MFESVILFCYNIVLLYYIWIKNSPVINSYETECTKIPVGHRNIQYFETKLNYPRLTRLRHSTKFIRQIKITSS